MFREGIALNELMTYDEFVRQNSDLTNTYDANRAFTLYMRRVYGDPTQDAEKWDLPTTFFEVLVDGHYRPIRDYEQFYGLWQLYQLNDCISLHKVTAVRYNKKYKTWNVKLQGRPGRDMWFSVPKGWVKEFGTPQVTNNMFTGTYFRVKDNKILREEIYI